MMEIVALIEIVRGIAILVPIQAKAIMALTDDVPVLFSLTKIRGKK